MYTVHSKLQVQKNARRSTESLDKSKNHPRKHRLQSRTHTHTEITLLKLHLTMFKIYTVAQNTGPVNSLLYNVYKCCKIMSWLPPTLYTTNADFYNKPALPAQ